MTSQELIQIATNEIGTSELPPNSNNVKYNTWYYGTQVSGNAYPWCAVFVSWLFKGTSLCKRTNQCEDMLKWFESKGQIVKSPKPGDIVFFKYSTNSRRTNHVGIVVKSIGGKVTTIEGNTSRTSQDNGGKVMLRERKSNIVAYARPQYDEDKVVIQDLDIIVKEVIQGKWGSGNDRRQRLTKAGYDYKTVQDEVNKVLKNGR